MSSRARLLIAILLGILLVVGTTVAATTAAALRSGTVAVEVHEFEGEHISIKIPAAVVDLAVALVPTHLVQDVADDAIREVRPYWPVVQAVSRELSRCPDAVFVEVKSRDEHIVIRKSGNSLVVQVESNREKVRVAVPLSTVTRMVDRLGRVLDRA